MRRIVVGAGTGCLVAGVLVVLGAGDAFAKSVRCPITGKVYNIPDTPCTSTKTKTPCTGTKTVTSQGTYRAASGTVIGAVKSPNSSEPRGTVVFTGSITDVDATNHTVTVSGGEILSGALGAGKQPSNGKDAKSAGGERIFKVDAMCRISLDANATGRLADLEVGDAVVVCFVKSTGDNYRATTIKPAASATKTAGNKDGKAKG